MKYNDIYCIYIYIYMSIFIFATVCMSAYKPVPVCMYSYVSPKA